jgi:hypothetical protein
MKELRALRSYCVTAVGSRSGGPAASRKVSEERFHNVRLLYYFDGMTRFAPDSSILDISAALLQAPGWARVGLTARQAPLRERAAEALAREIAERLTQDPPADDGSQFSLAL